MDSVQLKPKSEKEIFVSTPPPVLFGNGPNVEESSWTAANWLTVRFFFWKEKNLLISLVKRERDLIIYFFPFQTFLLFFLSPQSRFHFSFAEWSRGPSNFGPLRVMNDDLVQPKRGLELILIVRWKFLLTWFLVF